MRILRPALSLSLLASCESPVRVTSEDGPSFELLGGGTRSFTVRACHVDEVAVNFRPPELQISALFDAPSASHPAARARMVVRRGADFLVMDDAAFAPEAELKLTFGDLSRDLGSALCTEATEVTFDAPALPDGSSVDVEWTIDARSQEDLDASISVE